MNELKVELQKDIYTGLTDLEALAALPVQTTSVGRIQDNNKLDLLTLVITNNLVERYNNAKSASDEDLVGMTDEQRGQYREVARILSEAFEPSYILSDIYRINLGVPEIRGVFDGGLAFGLITQTEHDALIALATYTVGIDFSGYTEADVATARIPEPVFTEVTYISEEHPNQHLVRAASKNNDAIELEFTVTDGTQNVTFEVKTMAGTDLSSTEAKDNISNYQPVAAKWLVKMGESTNLVDHIEKNYKIKSVIKLFVKPSVNCTFTCVAR